MDNLFVFKIERYNVLLADAFFLFYFLRHYSFMLTLKQEKRFIFDILENNL